MEGNANKQEPVEQVHIVTTMQTPVHVAFRSMLEAHVCMVATMQSDSTIAIADLCFMTAQVFGVNLV